MQVFVDFIAAFNSMKVNIFLRRSLTFALLSFYEWIEINESHFRLVEYADDLALVGLLQKDDSSDEASYLAYATALKSWCPARPLEVNVSETKELVICTKPKKRNTSGEVRRSENFCSGPPTGVMLIHVQNSKKGSTLFPLLTGKMANKPICSLFFSHTHKVLKNNEAFTLH